MSFNRTYNGLSILVVRQNSKELADFFEQETILVVDPKKELISFLEKNSIPVELLIKYEKTQGYIAHNTDKEKGEDRTNE